MYLKEILKAIYSPHRCLLCGSFLKTFSESLYPVCDRCRETLRISKGIRCIKCSIPLISEDKYCMRCRNRNFSFENNFSLFKYSGKIKELLYQYKFNHEKVFLFSLLNYFISIISSIMLPARLYLYLQA